VNGSVVNTLTKIWISIQFFCTNKQGISILCTHIALTSPLYNVNSHKIKTCSSASNSSPIALFSIHSMNNSLFKVYIANISISKSELWSYCHLPWIIKFYFRWSFNSIHFFSWSLFKEHDGCSTLWKLYSSVEFNR